MTHTPETAPEKPAVEIVEVGPRDGFQGIGPFIPTETKIRMLEQLAADQLALGLDGLGTGEALLLAVLQDAQLIARGLVGGAGIGGGGLRGGVLCRCCGILGDNGGGQQAQTHGECDLADHVVSFFCVPGGDPVNVGRTLDRAIGNDPTRTVHARHTGKTLPETRPGIAGSGQVPAQAVGCRSHRHTKSSAAPVTRA